jgi:hypothetical protein
MKSFKELLEEKLNEGHERYPADDMTMKELRIAINSAKNIIEMLENGSELMRWQISAIVKASEELSSVYISLSADEEEEPQDDSWEDDMMAYTEYGYPTMYGEETELDEASMEPKVSVGQKVRLMQRYGGTGADKDRGLHTVTKVMKNYFEIDKEDFDTKKPMRIKHNGLASDYKKIKSSRVKNHSYYTGHYVTLENGKRLTEEMDFKVSVDGLPDMFVRGKSPSEVKANLRKIVKKPDMIQSVDRVTQSMVKKIFRDKAQGKDDLGEGYGGPVHRKNISDVVHEFVPKTDPKHDKIVDHLHKAKNYGNKTMDDLETVAGITTGSARRITKAVADHMKANFGSPSKTQTQAQRVDRYLKQKWVK